MALTMLQQLKIDGESWENSQKQKNSFLSVKAKFYFFRFIHAGKRQNSDCDESL